MNAEEATTRVDLGREAPFRLGALEVRPSTREVAAGERREVLEPRIMQVLVALARRRGEVVSRDDLIAQCWRGRAVGEDAINRCIAAVRRLAQSHGGFRIKTVKRVGYRLDIGGDEGDVAARPEPLLAVLAFDNLSGDPEMTYFSDGVSEEIQETVARGADLKVIGRTSAFQLRGADKTVRKAATELKATHVLDGSVRRVGQRVRISAQLIECASETTLWSDRFDRELTDIFALQDEIAAAVAAALRAEFSRSGPLPGRFDPAAYDLYLRARYETVSGRTAERIDMMERCVALEPSFARAWASLAMMRTNQAKFEGPDLALEPLLASARTAVATAERLKPAMGFTRTIKAWLEPIAAYQRREALMSEALRLTPHDPDCLGYMAALLGDVGRCRESLALLEEARSLDPLDPGVAASCALSVDENYAEQTARFDAMRAKWPAHIYSSVVAASFAAANADWPRYEALQRHAYAQPFAEHSGAQAWMREIFDLGDATRDGDRAYLDELANRLLPRVEKTGSVPLMWLYNAAAAGHVDAAYEAVDRASFGEAFDLKAQSRMMDWRPGAIFLRIASAALMDDPRFLRLCAKRGLVHYWLETGRWPDCADQVPYDFRAEARKVAAEGLARHL
jgi:TolB-like protein/DNA-binding winged helix-turn-helix (wHTH) protein